MMKTCLLFNYLIFFVLNCYWVTVNGWFCKFNKNLITERHNDLRLKHDVQPLSWDSQLEKAASVEVDLIKKYENCNVNAKQINTNYFITTSNSRVEPAVDLWYEGINNYDFELGPIKKEENVFEFTRMVWKSAQHIGCAIACCKNNVIFTCKYDSDTNKPGHFANNVKPINKMFIGIGYT
ncbi:cysteine-rich secretory protein, putative [Hepatocystis sp. ex Piliocolobus tephrosceles]|nr:cysteine-rich secretory protein, putative [Hepatocystis sp. ex Piliocolobus tephrosceles]